ncbi:MAG: hypothetical protein WC728_07635 [Elusimicrobiota bacterium]
MRPSSLLAGCMVFCMAPRSAAAVSAAPAEELLIRVVTPACTETPGALFLLRQTSEETAGAEAALLPVPKEGAPERFYDRERAQMLAEHARKWAKEGARRRIRRKCYLYVNRALWSSGTIPQDLWGGLGIYTGSAYRFAVWADKNPDILDETLALRKVRTPEDPRDIPIGSIVVFDRGHCSHRRHGHIAIVTEPGAACSFRREDLSRKGRCFRTPEGREKIHVYLPVK